MVSFAEIQSSNSRIATTLPSDLVAVFVGATSGIGEYTLKQFARYVRRPRVYFVGRSQDAGDRITAECKKINPEGKYSFIKADISLIRIVDDVCRDIKSKEQAVNLLFLSQGTFVAHTKTSEDLHYAAALITYGRTRFIVNLLPLLQKATSLRRVVSVFAATKEGPVDTTDLQAWKVSLMSARGHASSILTLSLEALAKKAPGVSFIHDFPGPVKSNIARGRSITMFLMRAVSKAVFTFIPEEESGERHLFLATSERYPARLDENLAPGVPSANGTVVARGTSGNSGCGVYSVDEHGESAGPQVEELLIELREDGTADKVWDDLQAEFKRITGLEAI